MASFTTPNRRDLMLMATAFGASLLPGLAPANAQSSTATARSDTTEADRIAAEFIGSATPLREGLVLDLPALGDNPSAVPVRAQITAPLSDDIWCEELIVLAELNPMPLASRFRFGQISGTADVSVRLRLIETMHVRALARLSDGRVLEARGAVTVASGGCGL